MGKVTPKLLSTVSSDCFVHLSFSFLCSSKIIFSDKRIYNMKIKCSSQEDYLFGRRSWSCCVLRSCD